MKLMQNNYFFSGATQLQSQVSSQRLAIVLSLDTCKQLPFFSSAATTLLNVGEHLEKHLRVCCIMFKFNYPIASSQREIRMIFQRYSNCFCEQYNYLYSNCTCTSFTNSITFLQFFSHDIAKIRKSTFFYDSKHLYQKPYTVFEGNNERLSL